MAYFKAGRQQEAEAQACRAKGWHDPSPTRNLDSAGTREQPALGPSLRGTENKGLNPSNSGDFSPIWTALAEAKDTLNAIGAAPEPGSPYEQLVKTMVVSFRSSADSPAA